MVAARDCARSRGAGTSHHAPKRSAPSGRAPEWRNAAPPVPYHDRRVVTHGRLATTPSSRRQAFGRLTATAGATYTPPKAAQPQHLAVPPDDSALPGEMALPGRPPWRKCIIQLPLAGRQERSLSIFTPDPRPERAPWPGPSPLRCWCTPWSCSFPRRKHQARRRCRPASKPPCHPPRRWQCDQARRVRRLRRNDRLRPLQLFRRLRPLHPSARRPKQSRQQDRRSCRARHNCRRA